MLWFELTLNDSRVYILLHDLGDVRQLHLYRVFVLVSLHVHPRELARRFQLRVNCQTITHTPTLRGLCFCKSCLFWFNLLKGQHSVSNIDHTIP